MATEIRNPRPAKNPGRKQRTVRIDDYLSDKLNTTRRQVRQVDVMSSLITLLSLVLVFLLTVAVIDAWIMPMGAIGRWVGFLMLIAGTLAMTFLIVSRTMIRKINPDYAARMIEESQPGFKNSLLNYVSLNRKPQGTKSAVMDAVSRQAATDISTVPVEALVDRSSMIRTCLVFAGIIFFGAMYTLFSPKDPFQSMARVLFPAAKIAPPSVVTIQEVEPGDAEAFFGDEVLVRAQVVGRHDPADVKLYFSTKDGQTVDRLIQMSVESGTIDRYVASLSTDGSGIQQSLVYHIVARDGATPEYSIDVRTNPSIAIENITLQPPKYTKLQSWSQPRGSIEAIEGTRVTIDAKANLAIKSANIELLNSNDQGKFVVAQKILMNPKADQSRHASGSFVVAMNNKRTRPLATHYRLNFVSADGHANKQPNNFPIKVIPDLAPEIQVLNPLEKSTQVPLNGRANIRVQANDADFEISKIELEVERLAQRIFGKTLPLKPVQGMQRVNGDLTLDISRQFPTVQVGDRLVFFASAFDNRVAANGRPDANVTRSENYVIEIVEPLADPPPQQQDPRQNNNDRQGDPQRQDPREQQPNDNQRQEDPDRDNQAEPNEEPRGGEQGQPDEREEQSREQQQGQTDERQGQPEEQQEREQQGQRGEQQQQPGEQQQGQPEGQQGQPGEQQQSEPGEQQPREQQGQSRGQEGQAEGQQDRDQQGQPGEQQGQRGEQQGQQGQEQGQPGQLGERGQPGEQQQGQQASGGGESAPENDAERMAKLNELLGDQPGEPGEQQGQQGQPGEQQGQQGQQQQGQPGQQGQQQGQQGCLLYTSDAADE